MKEATLGIVFDTTGAVLLAEKKVGEIGMGVLSGPGGKLLAGETLVDCLIRETKEEWDVAIQAKDIEKVAYIVFHAGGVPDFGVHIYRVHSFSGTLKETEDAKLPSGFPKDALPFEHMYDGDRHWISRAIEGEPFCANVFYKQRAKEFERIEFLPPDF